MGEVAQLEQPPDYGDGDGDTYDWVALECENCGKNEFAVWFSEGVGTLVCRHCQKPQECVYSMEVLDE